MTETSSNGSNGFGALLQTIGDAIVKAARYTGDAVASASWGTLAAICIVAAVVLTILPLAVALFMVFVAVKLILNAIDSHRTRGPATPYRDVVDKE